MLTSQVAFVFSIILWLLAGTTAGEFSTMEGAFCSIIRISLGESENFYPQILEAQSAVGSAVIVLYQVLGVVLLLTVVIAIILEVRRCAALEALLFNAHGVCCVAQHLQSFSSSDDLDDYQSVCVSRDRVF